MTALDRAVSDAFQRALAEGDAAAAERVMSEHLRALPVGPFHEVLDLTITNSPLDVAAYIDAGIAGATEYRRKVDPDSPPDFGATYLEMNGFPENPREWHFGYFAIFEPGPPDDTSWLGDFFFCADDSMVITGLEPMQRVYAAHRFSQRYDAMVASQIVLAKFQDLVARSAPHARLLTMRLFASAHDGWSVFEAKRR
jgi:hypothetical protein